MTGPKLGTALRSCQIRARTWQTFAVRNVSPRGTLPIVANATEGLVRPGVQPAQPKSPGDVLTSPIPRTDLDEATVVRRGGHSPGVSRRDGRTCVRAG